MTMDAHNPDTPRPDFWQNRPLSDLTDPEWEALCDGCGRCCLLKLEDIDTGQILTTSLSCRLLDIDACRCKHYSARHKIVSDCIKLSPATIGALGWLPETCAYRLLDEGKPLPDWHPLISGDPQTVHTAGISVRNFARSETGIKQEQYEDYILFEASDEDE